MLGCPSPCPRGVDGGGHGVGGGGVWRPRGPHPARVASCRRLDAGPDGGGTRGGGLPLRRRAATPCTPAIGGGLPAGRADAAPAHHHHHHDGSGDGSDQDGAERDANDGAQRQPAAARACVAGPTTIDARHPGGGGQDHVALPRGKRHRNVIDGQRRVAKKGNDAVRPPVHPGARPRVHPQADDGRPVQDGTRKGVSAQAVGDVGLAQAGHRIAGPQQRPDGDRQQAPARTRGALFADAVAREEPRAGGGRGGHGAAGANGHGLRAHPPRELPLQVVAGVANGRHAQLPHRGGGQREGCPGRGGPPRRRPHRRGDRRRRRRGRRCDGNGGNGGGGGDRRPNRARHPRRPPPLALAVHGPVHVGQPLPRAWLQTVFGGTRAEDGVGGGGASGYSGLWQLERVAPGIEQQEAEAAARGGNKRGRQEGAARGGRRRGRARVRRLVCSPAGLNWRPIKPPACCSPPPPCARPQSPFRRPPSLPASVRW
ncbi:hypothetical protein I4F81_002587 [Pyropia yezoensis]|uniref:Uncharacterized protein n=1 Tax=Pyropia yezoensis TaxID=2788 RepID=A0ACC3BPU3_PYRYE|nr:hypothetical protein I4F81_002587 [Neopyropia yezoensis]